MARLSNRQKKEIVQSFRFTVDDRKNITLFKGIWDAKELKPIKDRIREHYKSQQGKLCCYCKLPFRDDIHVEHIVPKTKSKYSPKGRPEFTFNPKNLAVACTHCNTKKSTNNDLIPWDLKQYPESGIYLRIIHPHFDTYLTHIQIVDKSRYEPKTVKGYNTIKRCKLYESNITENLVKYMRYEDDPIIQGVLRIRDLKDNFKNEIDRLLNFLL